MCEESYETVSRSIRVIWQHAQGFLHVEKNLKKCLTYDFHYTPAVAEICKSVWKSVSEGFFALSQGSQAAKRQAV